MDVLRGKLTKSDQDEFSVVAPICINFQKMFACVLFPVKLILRKSFQLDLI